MKLRTWVSLTLLGSFLVLAVSGLLLFFIPYSRVFNTIHIIFGFLFVLAACPHLWNNFKSIRSYALKNKLK